MSMAPRARTAAASRATVEPFTLPPAALLTNGRWTTLITERGTGFSRLGSDALTRWTPDATEDALGAFLYLRDRDSGAFWSAGLAPVAGSPPRYEATWQPGLFTITRLDAEVETRLEVWVAADAAAEIRRLTLRDLSGAARTIEVTSYAEVVLHDPRADAAHPAFAKLFVETAYDTGTGAVLARRRPRERVERHPWLAHVLHGPGELEHETDRARFLGRGHTRARPRALVGAAPLSGTVGNVLDPILSLRRTLYLAPHGTAELTWVLAADDDRVTALALAARFGERRAAEEALARARDQARELQDRAELSGEDAERAHALAVALHGRWPELRPGRENGATAGDARALLARLGVAPHDAMILVRANGAAPADSAEAVIRLHGYWRSLGLSPRTIVLGGTTGATGEPSAGVHFVSRDALSAREVEGLESAATMVVEDGWRSPAVAKWSKAGAPDGPPARVTTPRRALDPPAGPGVLGTAAIEAWNGYGGFAADGREYVMLLAPSPDGAPLRPPLPWINVLANPDFGTLVSESGAGCTWSGNSREHRLTPWSNDPILDPHGEATYVKDEALGLFWSVLPGPAPAPAPYEMRHGFGYTTCRHRHEGLSVETTVFVPPDDPVKVTRVTIDNQGTAARRISLVAYQRLVLGVNPEDDARSIITEFHPESAALIARNPGGGEFAARVAFAALVSSPRGATHWTCDRRSFIGRHGSPASPQGMRSGGLDGRAGQGLDPCFAQQHTFELAAGETAVVTFLLGEGSDASHASSLIERYQTPGAVVHALERTKDFWEDLLGGIRVSTPRRALDLMINGWLAYQTLACRIWGRTAFYQSGGAFGFRDQLQDAAALVSLRPEITRAQILLHAAHQFVEGDVLHWWHPPSGRGIRTRFADDLLWLPLVTARYVRSTGDLSVLSERVRFITARPLGEQEDEAFLLPEDSGERADLYEHMCRAIDRSLVTGRHGLPLFGSGDWNDGMNRVGCQGRGESVWMGFFLHTVLGEFLALLARGDDTDRIRRYERHRTRLARALNEAGWDGQWYRRGYYDDGTALGSASSDECRIDALAQAWAVISGAAPAPRAQQAMDAVERHLISESDGIIRLLAPPFERTPHDPGYIKGYPPGVRENGGQYTHAALWVVQAMAERGRGDRAARLLEMLTPAPHSSTPEQVARYQVEPYVVAADVYGVAPHVGRGGWTWYTGSAGWMLRVAVEQVLGWRVEGGEGRLRPCVPSDWTEFSILYRLPGEQTRYQIRVTNPVPGGRGVREALVDGAPVVIEDGAARFPLRHDGAVHRVDVVLG